MTALAVEFFRNPHRGDIFVAKSEKNIGAPQERHFEDMNLVIYLYLTHISTKEFYIFTSEEDRKTQALTKMDIGQNDFHKI